MSYQLYRWPLDELEIDGVLSADGGGGQQPLHGVGLYGSRSGPARGAFAGGPPRGSRCGRSAAGVPSRQQHPVALNQPIRPAKEPHARDRVVGGAPRSCRQECSNAFAWCWPVTTTQGWPKQRRHVQALRALAQTLQVTEHVRLVFSPSQGDRDQLLANSRCVLLHTPRAEHFGYVPLEAMAAGCPVVAANHGGPTETVLDGVTGLLCPPTPEAFAAALMTVIVDHELADRYGRSGRDHVAQSFSIDAFGERLWAVIEPLLERRLLPPPALAGRQA